MLISDMETAQSSIPDRDEPMFTAAELAKRTKFHPDTVRKMFIDEPGVLRIGHPGGKNKRQKFTLRIPAHVAERVFKRITVGSTGSAA
jgi:hypothetical protein